MEGYSSIVAEFETTVNLEEALQKVREKVDLAKPDLPAEAEDPSIMGFDFSQFPVMQVNLSGEYGVVRLKEIAEELQDRLEQIPSVLRADVRGGLEREVKVDVHLDRLQFYGLEIMDLIDAIRDENVNIPGGSIDVGTFKYLVRVDASSTIRRSSRTLWWRRRRTGPSTSATSPTWSSASRSVTAMRAWTSHRW